jgi:hypothetical protein
MKALHRLIPLLVVLILLASCAGERQEGAVLEAHSMEDALTLAADNNAFIVIEFWMDG